MDTKPAGSCSTAAEALRQKVQALIDRAPRRTGSRTTSGSDSPLLSKPQYSRTGTPHSFK
jgi:hypothetical protein